MFSIYKQTGSNICHRILISDAPILKLRFSKIDILFFFKYGTNSILSNVAPFNDIIDTTSWASNCSILTNLTKGCCVYCFIARSVVIMLTILSTDKKSKR